MSTPRCRAMAPLRRNAAAGAKASVSTRRCPRQDVCQIANFLFPNGFACAGSTSAVERLMEKAQKTDGVLQARAVGGVRALGGELATLGVDVYLCIPMYPSLFFSRSLFSVFLSFFLSIPFQRRGSTAHCAPALHPAGDRKQRLRRLVEGHRLSGKGHRLCDR